MSAVISLLQIGLGEGLALTQSNLKILICKRSNLLTVAERSGDRRIFRNSLQLYTQALNPVLGDSSA